MSDQPGGTVAIVEDDADLVDLYVDWIGTRYETTVAANAELALETVDATTDVLLLNRRLPDQPGDEILKQLRSDGLKIPVAMVSGVEPGMDILTFELDDYLHKPVERAELVGTVDRLMTLGSHPETVRAYLAATAKLETLRAELGPDVLGASGDYEHVNASVNAFERRVVSLAEAYLDADTTHLPREDRRALAADLRRLKGDEARLSRTDPLWSVARREIDEIEALLGTSKQDGIAERELLSAAADGFVARGFWLDPRILRALNRIFYDKDGDRLVVNQTPLTESTDLDGYPLLTVSRGVRERAMSILKNHRERR